MPCIPCQRRKQNIMEEKIRQLAKSGFDSNRIAAMLMIHKHKVEEVLAGPVVEKTKVEAPVIEEEPVVAKKTRKRKTQIEDETL